MFGSALSSVWGWVSQHWLLLMLSAIVYGLELIRRELAEISYRLELAHPTEAEARFRHEVEMDRLKRAERAAGEG